MHKSYLLSYHWYCLNVGLNRLKFVVYNKDNQTITILPCLRMVFKRVLNIF